MNTVNDIIESLHAEPERWEKWMAGKKFAGLCKKDCTMIIMVIDPILFVYVCKFDTNGIRNQNQPSLIDRLRLWFAVWKWKRMVK